MADVRSLLRQQRAYRRIEHPHAAYSDAGKLLCTICRDAVKTESLWEGHVQSEGHRTRAQKLQTTAMANGQGQDSGVGAKQKRKHDEDDEDVDMGESMRRKRSRPDIAIENEADKDRKDLTLTPPPLARRTSATPSQGVELQIPSRPATPAHRDGSSASTPGGQANPITSQSATTTTLPSRQPSSLVAGSNTPQVDESEWAAFEADIAAASAAYDQDAIISAPAMTADEAAAAVKAEEEAAEKRRAQVDVDLEDEKEEATRALEEEFEEMEELEARVRRLKEKREALRKRGESFSQEIVPAKPQELGKENSKAPIEEEDEDEDEEDDDDEDDDWDGFRFRTTT
ncbi:Fc.00g113900.m01.CDS01 [Cosmosporella sp. VM-42]